MSSGDTPPSISSTGRNGYDQDEFQPAGDDYINPHPSLGSMGHGQGNSHNHFENDQSTVKAPSIPDFGHGTRNSYVDGHTKRELGHSYGGGGQPPSVGVMAKVAVSQTLDGVDHPYNAPKMPGFSDVNQRGPSQNGISDHQDIVMLDAPEFVGISLVGTNFRKHYPNAYYKEKADGESN